MNRKIDNLYLPVHFVLAIFRQYSKKVWEKGSVIIWILEAAVFAVLFVISIKKNKWKFILGRWCEFYILQSISW